MKTINKKSTTLKDFKKLYEQTRQANWHLCEQRDRVLLENAHLHKTLDAIKHAVLKQTRPK